MIPVAVERVKELEQWDRSVGPGYSVECSKCGRCLLVPDDGKTPAKAARHAVNTLARTCGEPGARHYYRSMLPAGVRLEWVWRGERRPGHLVKGRVCGASGEVGADSPVYVVVTPQADPKKAVRANGKAEELARRLKRRGWKAVVVEKAVPQEATA